jgi:hypothetical protein
MTKPMSGAAYRANAEKVRRQRPTETVALSSGSVFELREFDIQGYALTGRVPQSLLSEGLKAWRTNGAVSPETLQTTLGDKQVIDSLVFMREVVHECCANPKFVEFAVNDDEIGAADMLPQDFTEIFEWAMRHQKGAGLDGLKSFRKGRERGASSPRARGTKQRPKAIRIAETEAVIS